MGRMELKEIEINKIKADKNQPRKTFDEESLQFLAESILGNGLITPIDVDENYIIIDCERRYRSHKLAGLKTISVRIVKLNKDNVERLKRQLISDLQNEETPTSERYEAIFRLWKMEKNAQRDLTRKYFCKSIGLSENVLNSIFDYCQFVEEQPVLAKQVSPRVITDTRSLPIEERKEIIEAFKEIPKNEKKTDLMRELVKQKKEQIKERKEREKIEQELEEQKKELGKRQFKITTDRDRLYNIRDEILQSNRDFNKLMSNIKWMGKTKFYLNTPKQKDNFIKFLEGASERAINWAKGLDDLREKIEIEIIRE